ncbi:MAG: anti-sigma B factor RsbW [Armatimonadetes bacterium]|nr:anti-sigma B factor RsbW [Armatimonadota bacterium]
MADNQCSACVELKFPCKPEYVGVARLAILGVASRMRFSYLDVEDIRLAVGEACTTSVEWAKKNDRSDSDIVMRSEIGTDSLIVDIFDQAGERKEENRADDPDQETENIGALLITLLVDEVDVTSSNGGTHVRMVKHARQR